MDQRILISEARIKARVAELAQDIQRDIPEGTIILLGVLKGAVHFLSDLSREIGERAKLDFIQPSSYGAASKSSGVVKLVKDHDFSIEGEHVLIVEDIVDTGLTLQYLKELLETRNPASLRTVALLSKPAARKVNVDADYVGFSIPNEFVVGYGLDFDERYRGLPHIAVISGLSGHSAS